MSETTPAFVAEVKMLPIAQLKPNSWNRVSFNTAKLDDLVASIQLSGIQEPLTVRTAPQRDGQPPFYEIASGNRRWMAAQKAGLTELPCLVRGLSDEEVSSMNLLANLQREDLPILEQARMVARHMKTFGGAQSEVAERFGLSRTAINELLGFSTFPAPYFASVNALTLPWSGLRAVRSLEKEEMQITLLNELDSGSIKVSGVPARVKQMLNKQKMKAEIRKPPKRKEKEVDPLLHEWEFLASKGYQVRYRGGLRWSFTIAAVESSDPKGDLAHKLSSLALILESEKAQAGQQDSVNTPGPAADPVKSSLASDPGVSPFASINLPKTPDERAELEEVAKQGPAAVYAKLCGSDSPLAQLMVGKSWEEIGVQDPREGVEQFIRGLENLQAVTPPSDTSHQVS